MTGPVCSHECDQGLRDEVAITSKLGFGFDIYTGARRGGRNSLSEHIKRAVNDMLTRLGADRIDLLYQRIVDPEVPIEDVSGAVKDLMDAGKVSHWGLSEMGMQTLRRTHAVLPLTAMQSV